MSCPASARILSTAAILAAAGFPAAAFADAGSELPRAMALQEPAPPQEKPKPGPEQEPPATPPPTPGPAQEKGLFDIGRIELVPRLTLVAYSGDFDADPEFGAGVSLNIQRKEGDLGAFLAVSVSSLERDDEGLPDVDADGTVFFVDLGMDYAFYRDETFSVAAQAGVDYAHFGGIDETDSGVGLLLGLSGAVRIAESISANLNPQVAIGKDQVFFVHLGVAVAF